MNAFGAWHRMEGLIGITASKSAPAFSYRRALTSLISTLQSGSNTLDNRM